MRNLTVVSGPHENKGMLILHLKIRVQGEVLRKYYIKIQVQIYVYVLVLVSK